MVNVAINGFGRIGRQAFRAAWERKKVRIVGINDLTDARTLAHLLRYDTAYGTWQRDLGWDKADLIVEGKRIPVFAEKDPALLPWKKLKVQTVLECTGRFTSREGAELHLKAGARKVIISAPGKGGVAPTYVMAVNSANVGKEESPVINNASCTTNCIAPVMAVLEDAFGIDKAMMTTVHGYTADQNLQDGPHKDLRRARAAAENIVPTSTGAAVAVTEAIPELRGKFDGLAIRVPVPSVSLSDITAVLLKDVTIEEVNKALTKASKSARFKGILAVTAEPLVSSDFIGNTHSAIVDLSLTNVVGGSLVKVVAWYDNETGYAARLVEMAECFV